MAMNGIETTQALAVQQGFGTESMTLRGETAATAVAAREQAAIQARYIMAVQRPRSIERFRVAMLDECKRPGFAAVARYCRPVGRVKDQQTGEWRETYAEGPSIRFIEAAIRNFRNIAVEVSTVFDSADLRIVRVAVGDLETIAGYGNEIQIPKQVERRGKKVNKQDVPPEGREVVGERVNSYGDKVYIVRATDDELLVRQAALVSKSIRTQAQRLLPGDVVEECMQIVLETQAKADAQDPQTAMRKLIDAFHSIGVSPDDLETWAGKSLQQLQPKEIAELRAIYQGVRDGENTWADSMEGKGAGTVEAAAAVAEEKLARMRGAKTEPAKEAAPELTQEQKDEAERIAALRKEEERILAENKPQGKGKIQFPGAK